MSGGGHQEGNVLRSNYKRGNITQGMVRVWVEGKTVWSPCYTRAISERFRDQELIIKRYINSPSFFTCITEASPISTVRRRRGSLIPRTAATARQQDNPRSLTVTKQEIAMDTPHVL